MQTHACPSLPYLNTFQRQTSSGFRRWADRQCGESQRLPCRKVTLPFRMATLQSAGFLKIGYHRTPQMDFLCIVKPRIHCHYAAVHHHLQVSRITQELFPFEHTWHY